MPQVAPLEASQVLVFIPSSLKDIDGAPEFTLRAATWREKDFYRDLQEEVLPKTYTEAEVRAETLTGLREGWSEDTYDRVAPALQDWWSRQDDFDDQKKLDDELTWTFDPEVERVLEGHVEEIAEAWPPLKRMRSRNKRAAEKRFALAIAVMVKSWTGITTKREMEGGYLHMGCAQDVIDALYQWEVDHKAELPGDPGAATFELYAACLARFALPEEEAKNSASPAPSATRQASSKRTSTRRPASSGKSQGSAASKTTRPKG